MMTVMVRKHGLEHLIAPPRRFSPLGWWEFPPLVEDAVLQWPDAALTVHCFNEMWRRAGPDKNAHYGAKWPFDLLKARYLTGEEDADPPRDVSSALPGWNGGD